MVAGLPLPAVGVKDKAVRAEPLLGDSVIALIVFVALGGILIRAIRVLADVTSAA